MSMRGYRTNEPDATPREESVLWRKVFESLWRDRQSKEHVARELRIPIDEIRALISGLSGSGPPVNQDRRRRSFGSSEDFACIVG